MDRSIDRHRFRLEDCAGCDIMGRERGAIVGIFRGINGAGPEWWNNRRFRAKSKRLQLSSIDTS